LWKDVGNHCRSCSTCQWVTKATPRKTPIVPKEVLTVPFEQVCVDLVGPLPKSKRGHKFLLTYIDFASRWPEAVPLRSTTAKSIIGALTSIFTRTGFPRVLISDNGPQFIGKGMRDFCFKFGIAKIESAPYRPQSNGIVESLHGTFVPWFRNSQMPKETGLRLFH